MPNKACLLTHGVYVKSYRDVSYVTARLSRSVITEVVERYLLFLQICEFFVFELDLCFVTYYINMSGLCSSVERGHHVEQLSGTWLLELIKVRLILQ